MFGGGLKRQGGGGGVDQHLQGSQRVGVKGGWVWWGGRVGGCVGGEKKGGQETGWWWWGELQSPLAPSNCIGNSVHIVLGPSPVCV